MRQDHEVCGRPEELALSLPPAAAQAGDVQKMPLGPGGAAARRELSRLARELGLGAYAQSAEALKSELQKIILALHPDKSGGEFRSDADKARFMKARRAIELLASNSPADAPPGAPKLPAAPQAITDTPAPVSAMENEHRLQTILLRDAHDRIGRYFAAPLIGSSALAAVLLMLVFTADWFARNPVLGPLFEQRAMLISLLVLGATAAAAAATLWLCERAIIRTTEHLMSESALAELFEHARRSARRQGRIGRLSTFDIRRGIDMVAEVRGPHRTSLTRGLLRRSLDATTRESITMIQTKRLLARRVIRPVDGPSIEVVYEVAPHACGHAFR